MRHNMMEARLLEIENEIEELNQIEYIDRHDLKWKEELEKEYCRIMESLTQ